LEINKKLVTSDTVAGRCRTWKQGLACPFSGL